MGSCYSGDHITGDYIHTYIPTCKTEEPLQKNSLGMVSYGLLGSLKHVLLGSVLALCFCCGLKYLVRMKLIFCYLRKVGS